MNTVVDKESLTEIGELVKDEDTPLVEDAAEKGDMIERLHTVLGELDTIEQEIIRHRYGIDGAEILTLEELSEKHELSEARIRQIAERALLKLRYMLT